MAKLSPETFSHVQQEVAHVKFPEESPLVLLFFIFSDFVINIKYNTTDYKYRLNYRLQVHF